MKNKLKYLLALLIASLLLLSSNPGYSAQSNNFGDQAVKDYRTGKKHLSNNNTKLAINYLKKAAHQGHEKAQYHLGILYYQKKQFKKARFWLRKRANGGEADAQYHYANTFRYALGTKQQTTIARRWYQKAAKQSHVNAQFELAKMFQNGIGAKKNTKRAKHWYQKAADAGHRNAKKELAKFKSSKETRLAKNIKKPAPKPREEEPKKPSKSEELLAIASKGDPERQYHLAMRYLLAYEIDDDTSQAIFWLTEAAEKNHPMAEYQLANQYFNGNHIKQNMPKAVHYFLRAYNNGVKAADTALKIISAYGYETIVLAEMGEKEAQFDMAMQFFKGEIQLEKSVALEWLEASAQQQYAPALLQIGRMYENGNVYQKDLTKAFDAYQQAAELENADAQFSLSQMYKLGKGTEIDPNLANAWLIRAANQGLPEAQKVLQFSEL